VANGPGFWATLYLYANKIRVSVSVGDAFKTDDTDS